jgi:small redox-active disulfide protein 2
MKKIEVLGTGCPTCRRLYANVEQAVQDLGIQAELVKVDDIAAIIGRGVMVPPALVVDGEIRAEGRVPDVKEIKTLLGA